MLKCNMAFITEFHNADIGTVDCLDLFYMLFYTAVFIYIFTVGLKFCILSLTCCLLLTLPLSQTVRAHLDIMTSLCLLKLSLTAFNLAGSKHVQECASE